MPEYDEIVNDLSGYERDTQVASAAAPSAGEVMLTLGEYAFSLPASRYRQLRRQTEYRWPAQELLGRRPMLQYTGPGTDRIALEGVVFPGYRGQSPSAVQALRGLAATGEPLALTAGDGSAYGRWAVRRIEETQTRPHADGTPRKIAYTLELEHSGADTQAGRLTSLETSARKGGDVRAVLDAGSQAAANGGDVQGVLDAMNGAAGGG